AAATWLLYDLVHSLNDEVRLSAVTDISLYRSADTVPKFLYLVSRYFGLFVQLYAITTVTTSCRPALIFNIVAIDILTLSIEISLMLRLYALYGRSRSGNISDYIRGVLIRCMKALAIVNGFSYKDFLEDIRPFPSDWPIRGCYLTNAPAISHVDWVPVLAFETVLFVMMSVKCYSYRNLREIPVLQRIWRDGTIYYFVLVASVCSPSKTHASDVEFWASGPPLMRP
ncbi:hypothetical protein WOLCODRAFT_81365, partial [Wolfiporia cocos MD-104 SS10]